MTKKSKPNVRKRQSSRLLKQVLSYNVEAAFKRINKGLKPAFQERPRNLDLITSNLNLDLSNLSLAWDSFSPEPVSSDSPKAAMATSGDVPVGGAVGGVNLNTSMVSMSSRVSNLEDKIRCDPEKFLDQSNRVTRALISHIPSQEYLLDANSEILSQKLRSWQLGIDKLTNYIGIIDDLFTDEDDTDLTPDQLKLLELEHKRLIDTCDEVKKSLQKYTLHLEELTSHEKKQKKLGRVEQMQGAKPRVDTWNTRPPDPGNSQLLELPTDRRPLELVNQPLASSPMLPRSTQQVGFQGHTHSSNPSFAVPATTVDSYQPLKTVSLVNIPNENTVGYANSNSYNLLHAPTSSVDYNVRTPPQNVLLNTENQPMDTIHHGNHSANIPNLVSVGATSTIDYQLPVENIIPVSVSQNIGNIPTYSNSASSNSLINYGQTHVQSTIGNTAPLLQTPLQNSAPVMSTVMPNGRTNPSFTENYSVPFDPFQVNLSPQNCLNQTLSDELLQLHSPVSSECRPPSVLEELIIADLESAQAILNICLDGEFSDVHLQSLDAKESKELSKLQSQLSDKLLKLENTKLSDKQVMELKSNALFTLKSCRTWNSQLSELIRGRELFSNSKSLGTPLQLERFNGWKSSSTIFEFLKQYNIITRNLSSQDRAEFLFCNYLSTELQKVCMHVRHNFSEMKSLLLKKYGSISILVDNKKKQVRQLNHPTSGNKLQELSYLKHLAEILDQTEMLVEDNGEDYPELRNDIFNYSFPTELVRMLPPYLRNRYSNEYVLFTEQNHHGGELRGRDSFQFLSRFIHRMHRGLELATETLTDSKELKDSKREPSTKKHSVNVNKVEQPTRPKNTYDPSKWTRSVCFMHKEKHKKVRDCLLGKCNAFLNATPEQRLKKAKEFKLCECCFMFRCPRDSKDNTCLFKNQLPVLVVCQACAVQGKDRNVLLCSSHKSDSPDVRNALQDFLPGYENDTFIKMLTLGILKLSTSPNSTETCSKVFDVSNGTTLDKDEVLHQIHPENSNDALYLMQMLSFNGKPACVLYDSGASTSAVKGCFAKEVGFSVIDERPQTISVAGGASINTGHGVFSVTLGPTTDTGMFHRVNMLGMTQITGNIPLYQLSELEKEAKIASSSTPLSKAKFPQFVGGSDVSIIVGIHDSFLMPKHLLTLPNGLMVYKGSLMDIHGSDLIFGGPHPEVSNVNRSQAGFHHMQILFTDQYTHYKNSVYGHDFLDFLEQPETKRVDSVPLGGILLPLDATCIEGTPSTGDCSLKGGSECGCSNSDELKELQPFSFCVCCGRNGVDKPPPCSSPCAYIDDERSSILIADLTDNPVTNESLLKIKRPKQMEVAIQEQEDTGSKITYRCASCQNCEQCKISDKTRLRSIREELDDHLIEQCIEIDLENKVTYSRFPFKIDPEPYLKRLWNGSSDNLRTATRIFEQQRQKSKECRESTVKFHNEIKEKGFVIPFKSLSEELQLEIQAAELRNYLYWRTTFKVSASTPARMVVDPSMSGFNDCLAKGSNCLNNLFMVMINWRSWVVCFTSDIQKMYNTIKLFPSEYKYTLYLWSQTLDPSEEIEVWLYVVVTYGLVSSGYVTTAALRRIATMFKDRYPLAYVIIMCFTYMDDLSGGASSREFVEKIIQEITYVIPNAGFKLKMTTISGDSPCEKASSDGIYSSFAGYHWDSAKDQLKLGMGEINFNKKVRGQKKSNVEPVDSEEKVEKLASTVQLTRRILLGKVMELYDLVGLLEPLKSKLKLDMRVCSSFGFDDILPENLQILWKENFRLMHLARSIHLKRSFVSADAINPEDIQVIMTCDAATSMCGVAAYCYQPLKNGSFSVNLITARSRSVSQTIPRNELESLVLAAETLFCINKALGSRVSKYWVLSDSEIVVCWVHNVSRPLRQYCFNRVQHIRRLIDVNCIHHIAGVLNPSDILTRGKVDIDSLGINGPWQSGPEWMQSPPENWPIRSYSDICGKLNSEQTTVFEKEVIPIPTLHTVSGSVPDDGCICRGKTVECHCTMGDLCCSCLRSKYEENCKRVLEANPILSEQSKNGLALSLVLSQIKAFTREDYPPDDIVNNFSGVIIYRDHPESMLTSQTLDTNGSLIALVHIGFSKSLRILALVWRFISKLRHKVHLARDQQTVVSCHRCNLQGKLGNLPESIVSNPSVGGRVFTSSYDFYLAWKYLCRCATQEVLATTTESQRRTYVLGTDQILYAGGRLDYEIPLQTQNMFEKLNFTHPVALVDSDLAYSVVMHIHWSTQHPGVERLVFLVSQVLFVEKLRTLCKYVRKTCNRCRYLQKKVLQAEVENQSQLSFVSAPPFFSFQMDIATGFKAHDINTRATIDCHFLVMCCMVTNAVSITVLESLKTDSIVLALSRHSDQFGWPKYILPDQQSSFTTLKELKFSFRDLQGELFEKESVILDFCTPGHHQSHGKIEVRVKLIKEMLESNCEKQRKHSLVEWDTIVRKVASSLNSLPMSRSGDTRNPSDMGMFSLITPNHFLFGKNSSRVPDGSPVVLDNPSKMLEKVCKTNDILQDILLSHIHRFIPGSNNKVGQIPNPGDIVLFVLKDGIRSRNKCWKFGRILANYVNGRSSLVNICYRNANESVFRELERHVSDVCIISHVDEISFNTVEHKMALDAQRKYLVYSQI